MAKSWSSTVTAMRPKTIPQVGWVAADDFPNRDNLGNVQQQERAAKNVAKFG